VPSWQTSLAAHAEARCTFEPDAEYSFRCSLPTKVAINLLGRRFEPFLIDVLQAVCQFFIFHKTYINQ
jgi:hypothetical protein